MYKKDWDNCFIWKLFDIIAWWLLLLCWLGNGRKLIALVFVVLVFGTKFFFKQYKPSIGGWRTLWCHFVCPFNQTIYNFLAFGLVVWKKNLATWKEKWKDVLDLFCIQYNFQFSSTHMQHWCANHSMNNCHVLLVAQLAGVCACVHVCLCACVRACQRWWLG